MAFVDPNIYCKFSGMVMGCVHDLYMLNARRPIVLEIGCADGQGTMRYAGFCDLVVCVDPMTAGRPDIFSTQREKLDVDERTLAEFKRRNADFPVELVMGCSLWPETLDLVAQKLAGRRIDALGIDGCHHPFEAVWGDFEAYYPFVARDGMVVFDDLYEPCIEQAYERAKKEKGMRERERRRFEGPGILQDVGVLVKTEG